MHGWAFWIGPPTVEKMLTNSRQSNYLLEALLQGSSGKRKPAIQCHGCQFSSFPQMSSETLQRVSYHFSTVRSLPFSLGLIFSTVPTQTGYISVAAEAKSHRFGLVFELLLFLEHRLQPVGHVWLWEKKTVGGEQQILSAAWLDSLLIKKNGPRSLIPLSLLMIIRACSPITTSLMLGALEVDLVGKNLVWHQIEKVGNRCQVDHNRFLGHIFYPRTLQLWQMWKENHQKIRTSHTDSFFFSKFQDQFWWPVCFMRQSVVLKEKQGISFAEWICLGAGVVCATRSGNSLMLKKLGLWTFLTVPFIFQNKHLVSNKNLGAKLSSSSFASISVQPTRQHKATKFCSPKSFGCHDWEQIYTHLQSPVHIYIYIWSPPPPPPHDPIVCFR